MGLYLAIFKKEEEINGLEVGSYEYFGIFRDCIFELIENNGNWGSTCPTIMNHSDCDGKFEPKECKEMISELKKIKEVFQKQNSNHKVIDQKKELIDLYQIKPLNLYDCFIDVDGENLIDRLIELCEDAIDNDLDIIFQ
ncbi:immunity 70 family protein [Flavobacterium johnsoniae]|uniref:Imm70 family immunity protein n=1 Tax=Flavobacterium johnsoniae TaxID=986 RepID=UPI0025B23A34|nr:Imm70 family immunity protein [Flavobacterium johnsoniae]WJS95655.1 immunity 70 family protein [Flavobacterium johnsoniae]